MDLRSTERTYRIRTRGRQEKQNGKVPEHNCAQLGTADGVEPTQLIEEIVAPGDKK